MKLLLSAVLGAAVCFMSPFAVAQEATAEAPAVVAADCNCAPSDCCEPTRCRTKKFTRVKYQKEVCRLRRVTVIDECGCERKKLMRVKECVTRSRLQRTNPCEPTCMDKIKSRLNCLCNRIRCCFSRLRGKMADRKCQRQQRRQCRSGKFGSRLRNLCNRNRGCDCNCGPAAGDCCGGCGEAAVDVTEPTVVETEQVVPQPTPDQN